MDVGKRILSGALALFLLLGAMGISARALDVPAPSAILVERTTGTVLYENNADELLAPASVTKVMTLLLVMEAIDDGRIGWQDKVTASEAAAAKGGSQVYLKVGETMTVEEMVKSVTVSSANDCACALAEHLAGSEGAFVKRMNARAKELGMENTHFVNCTGLDDSPEASEHRTTARDIAIMSRELLGHEDIKKYTTIWMDTVRDGAFGLSNTNKLVRFYEGTTGLKTGFTAGAGYCLSASAERDGMELIAVVLNCASSQDRFQAAKGLLDYGFASFALAPAQPEEPLPQVEVLLGKEPSLQPVVRGEEGILVDKSLRSQVTYEVSLPESVQAPVSPGQRLGTLTIRAGGQVLAELPLAAPEAVERKSYGDLLWQLLGRICMSGERIGGNAQK